MNKWKNLPYEEFACINPFAASWYPGESGKPKIEEEQARAIETVREWIARTHGGHPAFRGGDYLLIPPAPEQRPRYAVVAIFGDYDDMGSAYEQLLVAGFPEDVSGTIDSILYAVRSRLTQDDCDRHVVCHPF
jgi:hypothetical protein